MITPASLLDDAKCYEALRQSRWPHGVECPHCASQAVTKRGKHDRYRHRQRYCCRDCQKEFDDLTGSIFSGQHQPLRIWVICLHLMGLNLSNRQIAEELNLHEDNVHKMTDALRQAVVERRPEAQLTGEIGLDTAYGMPGQSPP